MAGAGTYCYISSQRNGGSNNSIANRPPEQVQVSSAPASLNLEDVFDDPMFEGVVSTIQEAALLIASRRTAQEGAAAIAKYPEAEASFTAMFQAASPAPSAAPSAAPVQDSIPDSRLLAPDDSPEYQLDEVDWSMPIEELPAPVPAEPAQRNYLDL